MGKKNSKREAHHVKVKGAVESRRTSLRIPTAHSWRQPHTGKPGNEYDAGYACSSCGRKVVFVRGVWKLVGIEMLRFRNTGGVSTTTLQTCIGAK